MSKRAVAIAIICFLLILAACESKTVGKRVAIPKSSGPTAAIVAQPETETQTTTIQNTETGKTAAEMLRELQANPETLTTAVSGEKSGTFYGQVVVTGTEREALKQKTRALFSRSINAPTVTNVERDFGSKYHDSDGDPINLPDKYEDNEGD